jgi:hypothetical protein
VSILLARQEHDVQLPEFGFHRLRDTTVADAVDLLRYVRDACDRQIVE